MVIDRYDNEIYSKPYWCGDIIYNEALTFIRKGSKKVSARLLFKPTEIISLRLSTLDEEYVEGKDFAVRGNEIVLLDESNIPIIEYDELFCDEKTFPNKDKNKFYKYLGEGKLAFKQVAVTYKHTEKWNGYIPLFKGDLLPRTYGKLKNREKIHITFVGDSITASGDISGISKIKPFMPRYPDMTVEALKRMTGADITFDNFAIGGTVSADFFKNKTVLNNTVSSQPDLLVIAYGMNDGTWVTESDFKNNVEKIYFTVKKDNPYCECIAISTLIPNTDACWSSGSPICNVQEKYEGAIMQLEKEGFAVACMTSVYKYLQANKDFYSLSANGINHPNDFVVRAYVHTLVSMLLEKTD